MTEPINKTETLSTVFSRIIEELGKMDKRIDAIEDELMELSEPLNQIVEYFEELKARGEN